MASTIITWRRQAQREYKALTSEAIDDKDLLHSITSTWNHLNASDLEELLKNETYKQNAMTYEMYNFLEQETGQTKSTKQALNKFLKMHEDKVTNN